MSTQTTPGQYRVTLPSGYTIERLPPGHAHDAWHLVFIGWPAADAPSVSRAERISQRDPLTDGVLIEVVGGSQVDRAGVAGTATTTSPNVT